MKTITKTELEQIQHLKKSFDNLEKIQESVYNLSLKFLDIEDNDWWFEYFYNDCSDAKYIFNKLNISVETE